MSIKNKMPDKQKSLMQRIPREGELLLSQRRFWKPIRRGKRLFKKIN